MATDTTKQCTITNNSGNDITVLLAVSDNETGSTGSIPTANSTYEVLKTTSGGTIIKKGSNGTVTLDRSYKPGTSATGYVQQYDLIVSDSNWMYPLALLPVVQQGENGSSGYALQTAGSGNEASVNQAVAFYQTITAYPDSALAKGYITALKEAKTVATTKADGTADAAAVADAVTSRMDTFFKGTKDYGQATLADVVAVDNYYNAFPAVWAQYKDDLNYYLYGSNGTTAIFAGTLSLHKTGALDATKKNSGYTCAFNPAKTPTDTSKTDVDAAKATILTYANGLFVDDAVAKSPNIALKGTFLLQRKFTGNPADTNILTVLVGKAAGVPCIAFSAPQTGHAVPRAAQQTPDSTDWNSFWDSLIHPQSQLDIIRSVGILLTLIVGGLFVSGGVLYGIYKLVKAVKGAVSREAFDGIDKNLSGAADESCSVRFGFTDEETGNWRSADFDEINKSNALFESKFAKGKLLEGMSQQHESVRTMLEFSEQLATTDIVSLQSALGEIRNSSQAVESATDDTLDGALKSELTKFPGRQTTINSILNNIKSKLSEAASTQAQDNLDQGAKIVTEITHIETDREQEETEIDPYVKNTMIPELATL